jgi:hypothetical protein
MEKLVKDFILKLEKQKIKFEKMIIENPEFEERNTLLLKTGKIIAFDYCISELKKIMESNRQLSEK